MQKVQKTPGAGMLPVANTVSRTPPVNRVLKHRKLCICNDTLADHQECSHTPVSPIADPPMQCADVALSAAFVTSATPAALNIEVAGASNLNLSLNDLRQPLVTVGAIASNGRLDELPASAYICDPCVINSAAPAVSINRPGLNGLASGDTIGLQTGYFAVTAQLPVQYTVTEVHGIFDLGNKALLRGVVPGSFPCVLGPEPQQTAGLRRFVVLDETVYQLYGSTIQQYFEHHGVEAFMLPLPTCEVNKELELVTIIADALENFKINRRQEPIIAIGGGVCLDVAGLAANLYRRNTCIVKVPTTLMAVVDAAVGIKTAVNFHNKKNKLGTYQPPLGVLYDTAFLQTLEARHISNGAAEVLKMACIKDAMLFDLLEEHGTDLVAGKFQGSVAATVVRRSIQGMLEELENNLWESILVRVVDYGHTVSPELEMAALRSPEMLLHGEAVAIDMALSTELAYGRGLLTGQQRARVLQVIRMLGLPLWHECCSLDLFMKGLEDMTRGRDGLQRMPLMNGVGAAVFVNDIGSDEMGVAANRLLQYAAAQGDAAAVQAVRRTGTTLAVMNNVVVFATHSSSAEPVEKTSSHILVSAGDKGMEEVWH